MSTHSQFLPCISQTWKRTNCSDFMIFYFFFNLPLLFKLYTLVMIATQTFNDQLWHACALIKRKKRKKKRRSNRGTYWVLGPLIVSERLHCYLHQMPHFSIFAPLSSISDEVDPLPLFIVFSSSSNGLVGRLWLARMPVGPTDLKARALQPKEGDWHRL